MNQKPTEKKPYYCGLGLEGNLHHGHVVFAANKRAAKATYLNCYAPPCTKLSDVKAYAQNGAK